MKIVIFPFCTRHSCSNLWVKNSLKIALSLTVYKIFTIFHFPLKSIEIFPLCRGYSCTTLQVKNRNLAISYSFPDVLFSAKIQDGCQKWEKLKLFFLHWTLLYYPVGEKFAQNHSIPNFYFPLKTKMVAKLKVFSPRHRILLYYPVGQKFARNHSISYRFRDIY